MLSGTEYASIGARTADAILEWVPRMRHAAPQDRLELLARQVRNLSDNQTLRAFALAYCFLKTLHHTIMFLSHGPFEVSWNELRFVVDRVHSRPNNREEQVFSLLVFSWLSAWSDTNPIATVREIHTSAHTIMRKYGQQGGLELGLMMRDKIAWQNSRTNWGLQIADMAAAIVGDAVQHPESAATLKAFVGVMRSACLAPGYALNVFTPHPDPPATYIDRYQPLVDALVTDQQRRHK